VQEIIAVINELIQARQKVMEDMDRLTGISDIMRGTSDARETLGGVRLKHNTTGTRLTSRQNEIARFARDTVRLMANVMSEHFSPQSLIEASGALYEEGLGPKDMPSLTALQGQQQAALPPPPPMQQQSPMPGAPPSPSPVQAAPGTPPGPPGPATPPAGQTPAMPQGGNVVPFRPQGAPPPPQPQMGAPAGMPGAMQGMPPQMGGMQGQILPPMPPELQAQFDAIRRIADAISLLRDDKLRGFRIDIEVDSTIFPDAAQEKQDRTEFISATTQFLETSMQMGQALPEVVPLLGKLLQFGVRGYKVGRDLEAAIDDFVDQAPAMIQKKLQQAQQQPNPEQMKAQADMAKIQGQMQIAQQKHQSQMAKTQADSRNMQMKSQMEGQKAQAEVQREQVEQAGDAQTAQMDMQSKQVDIQIKQMEMELEKLRMMLEQMKMKAEMQMGQQQMAHDQQKMQHESQQFAHHAAMDQQHMQHEQTMGQQHMQQDAMRAAQPQQPRPMKPGV
jgi:hypothetical protein